MTDLAVLDRGEADRDGADRGEADRGGTARAVLSVDVELFAHTPAYRRAAGELDDRTVGLAGLEVLHDLLEAHDAAATWFVVSAVAGDHPDAVGSLATAGHEIGSHTHTHRLLSELTPEERRTELARSRRVLERATGETVAGFRAPAFDLPADHFTLLAEAGYDYDSSVIDSRRIPGWYGGGYSLRAPAPASTIDRDAPPNLVELPVSAMPGLRLPLTGAWLRFFGPRYTVLGMHLLARRGITPVLYVHPWEFVDLPAVEGVPTRVYWHTGDWMCRALERILARPVEFVTAGSIVDEEMNSGASTGGGDAGQSTGWRDGIGGGDG